MTSKPSAAPGKVSDLEPFLVKPRAAWQLLGCGNTHGYRLLATGELESFLDGRSRKITVESIRAYIARRLALAGGAPTSQPQLRRRGRRRKSPAAVVERACSP